MTTTEVIASRSGDFDVEQERIEFIRAKGRVLGRSSVRLREMRYADDYAGWFSKVLIFGNRRFSSGEPKKGSSLELPFLNLVERLSV